MRLFGLTIFTDCVYNLVMKREKPHKWKVAPKEAVEIQKKLAGKIILRNALKKLNYISGVDVSYRNGNSIASVCVLKYPELECVECEIAVCKTGFPYIPGLLTFREGPAVIKCVKKMRTKADVFLFDGQGIAHPRWLGIATHMGILLDTPAIGCAKSFLYGECETGLGMQKGSFVFINEKNRKTRSGLKVA